MKKPFYRIIAIDGIKTVFLGVAAAITGIKVKTSSMDDDFSLSTELENENIESAASESGHKESNSVVSKATTQPVVSVSAAEDNASDSNNENVVRENLVVAEKATIVEEESDSREEFLSQEVSDNANEEQEELLLAEFESNAEEEFEPIITKFDLADFTEEMQETEESQLKPYSVDEEISVATCVDNEMSFEEALESAREEVGSNGIFEWNGNLFATFEETEWSNMTDDQKETFVGHIQWIDADGIHFDFQEEPIMIEGYTIVDDITNTDSVAEVNEDLLADIPDIEIDEIEEIEVEVEKIDLKGDDFATFYEKEWANMTDDEKEAVAGHILWTDEDGIHVDYQDAPIPTNSSMLAELEENIMSVEEADVEILGLAELENDADSSVISVDGSDDVLLVDVDDSISSSIDILPDDATDLSAELNNNF